MEHGEFVRLYRAGQVAVAIDDGTARHLVENHPDMPRRYYYAHLFWSWVWLLTGIISLGLIPVLFRIKTAINEAARSFVTEFALENSEFYDKAIMNRWMEIRPRD